MDELKALRKEIDQIDTEILGLLSKRFRVIKKVGQVKHKLGLKVRDTQREQELLDRITRKAQALKVEEETVAKIWKSLFKLAYRIEK